MFFLQCLSFSVIIIIKIETIKYILNENKKAYQYDTQLKTVQY